MSKKLILQAVVIVELFGRPCPDCGHMHNGRFTRATCEI